MAGFSGKPNKNYVYNILSTTIKDIWMDGNVSTVGYLQLGLKLPIFEV